MNPIIIIEAIAFALVGAVVAAPFLWLNLRFASRLSLIDWPKARGISQQEVPIIGYALVTLTLGLLIGSAFFEFISPWVVVTSAIIALVGHLDDRHPLPPIEKLVLQFLCVIIVVFCDPNIQTAIGDKYGIWGDLIAIFFIVGLVNAINFIDGIDGLAGTVLVVGSLGCVLLSQGNPGSYPYFVISSLILGMMVPFLYLNVSKKRGFLGNVGSYFFGYLLAVMHLSVPLNSIDPIAAFSISALCFLIPIADSVTVVTTRLLSVRSPFQGDKGHLHHRLVQSSLPLRYVLLNFSLIGLAGVVIAYFFNTKTAMHHSRLPLVICFAYIGIISLLIGMIEKASKKRLQGYFMRFDEGSPVYFLKYRLRAKNGESLSNVVLKRLEAKISTEIRVNDVCFAKAPDELFVILSALEEPIAGVSQRIKPILDQEDLEATLLTDRGEYLKLSYQNQTTLSGPSSRPVLSN